MAEYDIFLSHASRDEALVEQAWAELKGLGYSVFLDRVAMPTINPAEVTEETAEELRNAMRQCTSLVFVITANVKESRWMPWELGFFDGFSGRVFIYPSDGKAEAYAKGQEYLRIYPKIPRARREAYLKKYLPKRQAIEPRPGTATALESPAHLKQPAPRAGAVAPLYDFAPQQATEKDGAKLRRAMSDAAVDPSSMLRMMGEIAQAWWRLWGLMPPPRRPGAEEGKWR